MSPLERHSPTVIGVVSPAVAGVASLADLSRDVTLGVASLAIAGVASLADMAGSIAGGVTFLTVPVSFVTDGKTFLERSGVQSGSVFVGEDCDDDWPDCCDCDGPGGVDIGPDVMFLTEPVRVASPDRTYIRERLVFGAVRFMGMMIMVAVAQIVLTVLNRMVLTVLLV